MAAMGLTFTKLFARLFSKKEMRILMVSRVAHPRDAMRKCLAVVEGSLRPVRRLLVHVLPAVRRAQHGVPGSFAAHFEHAVATKACGCGSCQQQACQF